MDRIAEELSDARAAVLQWASKDSAATKAVAQVFDKLRLALQATGNLTAGADSRATLKAQARWYEAKLKTARIAAAAAIEHKTLELTDRLVREHEQAIQTLVARQRASGSSQEAAKELLDSELRSLRERIRRCMVDLVNSVKADLAIEVASAAEEGEQLGIVHKAAALYSDGLRSRAQQAKDLSTLVDALQTELAKARTVAAAAQAEAAATEQRAKTAVERLQQQMEGQAKREERAVQTLTAQHQAAMASAEQATQTALEQVQVMQADLAEATAKGDVLEAQLRALTEQLEQAMAVSAPDSAVKGVVAADTCHGQTGSAAAVQATQATQTEPVAAEQRSSPDVVEVKAERAAGQPTAAKMDVDAKEEEPRGSPEVSDEQEWAAKAAEEAAAAAALAAADQRRVADLEAEVARLKVLLGLGGGKADSRPSVLETDGLHAELAAAQRQLDMLAAMLASASGDREKLVGCALSALRQLSGHLVLTLSGLRTGDRNRVPPLLNVAQYAGSKYGASIASTSASDESVSPATSPQSPLPQSPLPQLPRLRARERRRDAQPVRVPHTARAKMVNDDYAEAARDRLEALTEWHVQNTRQSLAADIAPWTVTDHSFGRRWSSLDAEAELADLEASAPLGVARPSSVGFGRRARLGLAAGALPRACTPRQAHRLGEVKAARRPPPARHPCCWRHIDRGSVAETRTWLSSSSRAEARAPAANELRPGVLACRVVGRGA